MVEDVKKKKAEAEIEIFEGNLEMIASAQGRDRGAPVGERGGGGGGGAVILLRDSCNIINYYRNNL